MPETPIPSPKATLRDSARHLRSTLTPAQITEMSGRICTSLLMVVQDRDPLMVYVSKPLEVDTHSLLGFLLENNRRVVVPIIERESKTLRLSAIKDAILDGLLDANRQCGNEPALAFWDASNEPDYNAAGVPSDRQEKRAEPIDCIGRHSLFGCRARKLEGFRAASAQVFGRVIAPSEAELTSAAYLAKTPLV